MSEENSTDSLEDGEMIYRKLRSKYPDHTKESFNQIINSMCAALYVAAKSNVNPTHYTKVVDLVHEILTYNLKK